MANREMIGKKFHFDWRVERGKIAEFVAAVGEDNPICWDTTAATAQGYVDIVAPPTFTTVPMMWSGVLFRAFDELKMPLSRIMHAEQAYEYHNEILPDDTLSAVMEVKSVTERSGKSGVLDFVLFETIFTNQHGQLVMKEEMLVVERK